MEKEGLRVATFAGRRTEPMIAAATEDLFPDREMIPNALIAIVDS